MKLEIFNTEIVKCVNVPKELFENREIAAEGMIKVYPVRRFIYSTT